MAGTEASRERATVADSIVVVTIAGIDYDSMNDQYISSRQEYLPGLGASAIPRRVDVYAALAPPVMNRATVVAKIAFESLNIIVEER